MDQFNNHWYMHTPDKAWPETLVRLLDPINGGMAEDIYDFIRVNYLRKGPFTVVGGPYKQAWRVAIVGLPVRNKGKGQGSEGGRNHIMGVVYAQSCKFAFQYQRDGPFTAFL